MSTPLTEEQRELLSAYLDGEVTDAEVRQHVERACVVLAVGLAPALVDVVRQLRGLLEAGFEVHVMKDATAAAQHPELGDGYAAAVVDFGYLANGVVTTQEAVAAIKAS